MTLTEVYKNLDCNLPIDEIILDILEEEAKKPIKERIYADMGKREDFYTICEVIREIFKRSDDVEILKRCILIQLFAKKMARKLQHYASEKRKFDFSEFFPKRKE